MITTVTEEEFESEKISEETKEVICRFLDDLKQEILDDKIRNFSWSKKRDVAPLYNIGAKEPSGYWKGPISISFNSTRTGKTKFYPNDTFNQNK